MRTANKTVRQSVSLPEKTAAQVRTMAKTRRVSSNRILVELIAHGIEAEKRRQQEFFELANRFRSATDPQEAKRLASSKNSCCRRFSASIPFSISSTNIRLEL